MIPLFDLSTPAGRDGLDARLTRLRATSHARSDAADTVAQIVEAVRTEGDAAVVRYMRQWTDPHFEAGRIRVTADELASFEAELLPTAASDVTDLEIEAIENNVDDLLSDEPSSWFFDEDAWSS